MIKQKALAEEEPCTGYECEYKDEDTGLCMIFEIEDCPVPD